MELLADGQGREGLAIMIAGDDEAAKLIAKQLVVDAKFQAVDLGVLAQGRVFQAYWLLGGSKTQTRLKSRGSRRMINLSSLSRLAIHGLSESA